MRFIVLVVALCLAAGAGAWAQARYFSAPVLSLSQEQALVDQASRDSAYVRQATQLLASKVGELQARIIAIADLSRRVAHAAGVAYTEPEIQAVLDDVLPEGAQAGVMDDISTDDSYSSNAEHVGRQLDMLARDLSAQEGRVGMLDLLMTQRSGLDASVPTLSPVDYPYLSSSFGWRKNPVTGRYAMHEGLDFAAPKGAPIFASSSGIVIESGFRTGYGYMVDILHGTGIVTRYAHASVLKVEEGDLVEKGQTIALVGSTGRSTGPHLHFEVRMGGHPLDPKLFLPKQQPDKHLVATAESDKQTQGPQVR